MLERKRKEGRVNLNYRFPGVYIESNRSTVRNTPISICQNFTEKLGKWEASETLVLRGKRPGDFNRLESPCGVEGYSCPSSEDMVVLK